MPTTRAAAVLVLAFAAALLGDGAGPAATAPSELRILLFTKTAGFRHDSIPTAVQALRDLGAQNHIEVDAAEDAAVFADERLRRYDVVVFLLTTGDILDDRQQAAVQRYIRSGGGFAGVHSASDTEHDWQWYGGLVGAYFRAHPQIQQATVVVSDPRDASTRGLPRLWQRTDEWYGFATSPSGSVRVLATLDEASYAPDDSAMGGDHPIAWSHLFESGRAWYTAAGHTRESYAEPLFRSHLLGGILWAAGPPDVRSLRGGRPGRPTRRHRRRGEVHPLPCRAPCPSWRPHRRRAAPHRGRHVRRPDRGPAARVLGLRRDGSERREWAPDDPDRNRSDRLAPGTADRPAEELVRTELGAALLALDLERRGQPRVARRAARDERRRALRAGRRPLVLVRLEVPRDVPAGGTESDPVAEGPAPLLLDPVPLRHRPTVDLTRSSGGTRARRARAPAGRRFELLRSGRRGAQGRGSARHPSR